MSLDCLKGNLPEVFQVFSDLLASRDVMFRHGEDADFDRELQIERRVRAYARPSGTLA